MANPLDENFVEGAARVSLMVEMALERGMSTINLRGMLQAYKVQLEEWQASPEPGQPPSGFALVGTFHEEKK